MPIQQTVKVGNDTVAKIAHGLMTMTLSRAPNKDTVFEALKSSLDSLPEGVKMILNGGEFYAPPENPNANLDLIAEFFEKYPDYVDKAFLSIKGGMLPDRLQPVGTPENLTRSVDHCIKYLRDAKKIDLFEPARIDPSISIEEQMKTWESLRQAGKFTYIGLSEVRAETIRRANVIAPVSLVEIEISPISYEEETKKVIETCRELGIPIAAYSPVGKGFLTGSLTKLEDLPKEDRRHGFSRFKPENFDHNAQIGAQFQRIAQNIGITPAQLAIAWVSALGDHIIPLPGWSNSTRGKENIAACDIILTPEQIKIVDEAVASYQTKGGRAIDGLEKVINQWG